MDVLGAVDVTLELAISRGTREMIVREGRSPAAEEASFAHLANTRERMDRLASEAKMNRWLGYAQGVVVASGCATLEEMKEINRRASASE